MNKNHIVFIFFFSFAFIFSCNHSNNNKTEKRSKMNYKQKVITQQNTDRIYHQATFDTIMTINFEKLDKILYQPLYCVFKDCLDVYILDAAERIIHRFSFQPGMKTFDHYVIGKGKGQGPGELNSQLPCLQVFEDQIYIADPLNGSIQIYHNKGNFLRSIKLRDTVHHRFYLPEKFVVLNANCIIVHPREEVIDDFLLIEIDSTGAVKRSLGPVVDDFSRESIYQYGFFIKGLNKREFGYIWINLCLVGFSSSNTWNIVKECIGGAQKPDVIRKKVVDDVYVRKLNINRTILDAKSNSKYILFKVWDKQQKRVYYDIYKRDTFEYMYSIKNMPKMLFYDLNDQFLVGVEDIQLKIFKTSFSTL